jgi:excisionase family DNA binding protein
MTECTYCHADVAVPCRSTRDMEDNSSDPACRMSLMPSGGGERTENQRAAGGRPPQADLLLGAGAIATYLGVTRRQVYRLVYDSIIPSFKAGGTVAARKSSLDKWMAKQETEHAGCR